MDQELLYSKVTLELKEITLLKLVTYPESKQRIF